MREPQTYRDSIGDENSACPSAYRHRHDVARAVRIGRREHVFRRTLISIIPRKSSPTRGATDNSLERFTRARKFRGPPSRFVSFGECQRNTAAPRIDKSRGCVSPRTRRPLPRETGGEQEEEGEEKERRASDAMAREISGKKRRFVGAFVPRAAQRSDHQYAPRCACIMSARAGDSSQYRLITHRYTR